MRRERQVQPRTVSRETLEKARQLFREHLPELEEYLDQLLWWNRKVNLVSREVSRETLREHLTHSLLPVVMGLFEQEYRWLDAGTGGGLPGIPLAITDPSREWILNDISVKKIAAVRQIAWNLDLKNVRTVSSPVETVSLPFQGIVTKHAFHAGSLWRMTKEMPWNRMIFYKGADEAKEEITQVLQEWEEGETAHIFRFDFGEGEPFYEGKAILVLDRAPLLD